MKTDITSPLGINTLGHGGPRVSNFALGAMTFGAETNEADAFSQLDCFVDHGGTFIDTADVYSDGVSEQIIGKWGRQRGGLDDLVIATKGRFAPPAGSHGASRRSLLRSVNASLERLQIDAIDLYFIHGWDQDTDVADTLATLADLVTAGKIHHIAWSNLAGWQLQKIVSTAEAYRLPMPVALQPQYSLLERGIELEVLPCCLSAGIALTPWSPLAGGWLTGKYQAHTRPTGNTRLGIDPNRGVEAWDLRNTDKTWEVLAVLETIAEQHARPAAHIALAWLASRPGVASILLGVRTLDQLRDNLAAAELQLSETELAQLTVASATGLPAYPYRFLENWSRMDIWKTMGTD
ncbi:aldo/keto reductase [Granulosicoccus sp. 3-233]|uniref:aldo/keto reductase n=1 Tax=Granulosicoccus sp. 3-233 TaxID=3417969 RepID=UPI003D335DBB